MEARERFHFFGDRTTWQVDRRGDGFSRLYAGAHPSRRGAPGADVASPYAVVDSVTDVTQRSDVPQIRTPRLRLRAWRDSDREPFARLNADPHVMEHFPSVLTAAESDALVDRIMSHFSTHGFGLWAVEVTDLEPFIGFIGLSVPTFQAHFTPCVEIGWRLAAEHWRHGYATEGARAALYFAFHRLELDEVVSFTVPANMGSRQVMERLGMHRDSTDDFDHPSLPEGHTLRRHVLYRLKRSEWRAAPGSAA